MDESVDFPYKTVITFSIYILSYQFILFYSVKIARTIYINFVKQDLTLFLTSLSIVLSILFEIATLSMQLLSVLSQDKDHGYWRKLYYNLFRTIIVVALCFEVNAFLFDMFKWITFLTSASIETAYLNEDEKEKLLNKKNK